VYQTPIKKALRRTEGLAKEGLDSRYAVIKPGNKPEIGNQ